MSDYQLYTLPNKTSIADNQTKQLALIEQNNVTYHKEGRLNSSLYFDGDYAAYFEKQHPAIYYIMENNQESNLGIPLPKGVIRFYENDSKGNLQFIGENTIGQTAKGEKIELNLGTMFDVFIKGKVTDVRKVDERVLKDVAGTCPRYQITRGYDAQIVLHNGGDHESEVVFIQTLSQKATITKENMESSVSDRNANQHEWRIKLPADSDQILIFTVEVVQEETRCR